MAVQLTLEDASLASSAGFLRLGAALDALSGEGRLFDEDEANPTEKKRIRICRTYLYLMGYLNKDNRRDRLDANITTAIAAFQNEAGIESTGALDEHTWNCLVQLVPFDTESAISYWIEKDEAKAALTRAIHLRLYCYGLMRSPPPKRRPSGRKAAQYESSVLSALEDFCRVATVFGSWKTPPAPTYNPALIDSLFAHSRLINSMKIIAGRMILQAQHPGLILDEGKLKRLLRTYTDHLALVELWLLGYEVTPGIIRGHADGSALRKDPLKNALSKFAGDRELKGVTSNARSFRAWFFQEAQKLYEQPSGAGKDEVSDEHLTLLLGDKKQMTGLRKSYLSLGARILDGAKRAFNWIVGLVRKAARAIKQLVRNLARTLHRGALEVYRRLKAMISVTRSGFAYFMNSPVGGSNLESIYAIKKRDFDMDLIVNPQLTGDSGRSFFDRLNLQVEAMELGGRIIGELWRLILVVIKITASVIGWLELIIILVRMRGFVSRLVAASSQALELLSRQ